MLEHLLMTRISMDFAGNVKLDAVAGAEQHRFACGVTRLEIKQKCAAMLFAQRQTLAQRQRRGRVVHSQQEQAVHGQGILAGSSRTVTISPTINAKPTMLRTATFRP